MFLAEIKIKERTEIIPDIEGGSGRPVLHIRNKIPAGSSTDCVVSTANASEENRSEYNDDYSFHRPHWPHFPLNQTEKLKLK